MLWTISTDGVFESEYTENDRYGVVYPESVLRGLWGHKETFRGYDLYDYYGWVGSRAFPVDPTAGHGLVVWGSLEECLGGTEDILVRVQTGLPVKKPGPVKASEKRRGYGGW